MMCIPSKLITSLFDTYDSIDVTKLRYGYDYDTMLGITNLHISMILSTLNISSHVFSKDLKPMKIISLTYIP